MQKNAKKCEKLRGNREKLRVPVLALKPLQMASNPYKSLILGLLRGKFDTTRGKAPAIHPT
jgi:hypothetical protein